MKRYVKRLINCFAQWVGKMRWEEKIGLALGVITGITIAVVTFVFWDTTRTTPADYQPLEAQAISIQQNPKLLLEKDCNIDVNGEVITVCLENEKCKVIAKYDKNFEMLSTSKKDKSVFWLWAILGTLAIGIWVNMMGFWLYTSVIYLLEILWQHICKKLQLNLMKAMKQ